MLTAEFEMWSERKWKGGDFERCRQLAKIRNKALGKFDLIVHQIPSFWFDGL